MYVVVDVGGTNTRVAASKDGKTLDKKEWFSTPQDFEEGIAQISKKIDTLRGKEELQTAVIGVPGTIDRRSGKAIKVPHIPSWGNKDLAFIFQTKLGISPTIANDAELAALGEAVFGAGKDYRIVGYLTVSTGIGGALVVDKKLVPRAYNSEPGHMIMALQGTFMSDLSQDNDWEVSASGKGFQARFGVSPQDCDDPTIWSKHVQLLGPGVIAVILLWSPEILVIGGGLSRKGDLLFKPLHRYVHKKLVVFPPPPIVPAQLGDDAGLYGGLALLRNKRLKEERE